MNVYVVTERVGDTDETRMIGVFSDEHVAMGCRLQSLARRCVLMELDAWPQSADVWAWIKKE